MDEQSWLACQEPHALYWWLEGSRKLSPRKARLFGAACVRRIWHLLEDERSRRAVEVTERFSDGLDSSRHLRDVYLAARASWEDHQNRAPSAHSAAGAVAAAVYFGRAAAAFLGEEDVRETWGAILYSQGANCWSVVLDAASQGVEDDAFNKAERTRYYATVRLHPVRAAAQAAEKAEQAALLRDLFGNPFRPVVLEPSWLTPQVVALARRAYDERKLPQGTLDPDLLARLADALEDAGCTDRDVIRHCRWEQGHVRGCWLVDRILGRS